MKRLLTLAVAGALLIGGVAQAASPKREMRSAWLTSHYAIDWPSSNARGNQTKTKAELTTYLDNYKARNFTGVCFQVRCLGDAYYASSYEPWASTITGTRGKNPGWDPLEFVVEECHKRGLECYAWVNPFRFNIGETRPKTTHDLEVVQKGWIISNHQTGSNNFDIFNPANPEVRQYVYNILKEIYTNYRIDGMIFDDYFYPNPRMAEDNTADDWADFQRDVPGGKAEKIADWRRNNVNEIMRHIYDMIQQDRPDMRFGIGPAGNADKGAVAHGITPSKATNGDYQYENIYSDPCAWLIDGSIDFVSPQIYWYAFPESHGYAPSAPFGVLSEWWHKVAADYNRHCYVSYAPYRMYDKGPNGTVGEYNNEQSWKDLSAQIEYSRQHTLNNAPGAICYSAKYLDGPALSGWGEYLQANTYTGRSLQPVITWKDHQTLSAPDAVRSGSTLKWSTGANTGALDPIIRYTVYAIPQSVTYPEALAADNDGIDAKYLLDVVYGKSFTIPTAKVSGHWYAVCTYDGYGYESAPCLVDYSGSIDVPVPTEGNKYDETEQYVFENLWYLNTSTPAGLIGFDPENGSSSRGMVIAGDKIYTTDRTGVSDNPRLHVFSLENGKQLADINLNLSDAKGYVNNGIMRDSENNIYIANMTLNVTTIPLQLYRFDPASGKATLWVECLGTGTATNRLDHCAVEALGNGRYYVWGAMSSGTEIVRWTVENNQVTTFAKRAVTGFNPSSSKNFGIAPHIAPMGNNKVVVDGGSTNPAEYDFTTGKIVSASPAAAPARLFGVSPEGTQANGFVHFGPAECHMAYVSSDHQQADGFKFSVVTSGMHGFNGNTALLYRFPQTNMGKLSSTHCSTPIDAVHTVNEDGSWEAKIAAYAPGNGLALYSLKRKTNTGVNAVAAEVSYTLGHNAIHFSSPVDVEIFTPAGLRIAAATAVSDLSLPTAKGIYLVRFNGTCIKIVR